jgi:peptidoglycan hydrolase-like protein with peptidoglycan-binding domain
MSEADDGRPCPACGRFVATPYCAHCGARVVFTGPLSIPSDDAPTIPSLPVIARGEGPAAAAPEMFPTEMVPAAGPSQAWSQAPDPAAEPQTGLFPGWTGMYPAVAADGGAGALAPRPERRRKAIYAVLAIVAATVIVLVAALLIAPHLGDSGSTAEKDGQPVAVSSADVSPSSSNRVPAIALPSAPVAPVVSPPVNATVTVTAPAGTTVAPKKTVPAKTTAPTKPPARTTAKPSTAPKPTPVANPLGVPQREITCNPGYVVQLASELDAAAFAAHVSRLKASGQLPPGSLAADSAKSCKIFTSQVNTLVLYSGPYAGPYEGCAARLAGPADAFIKGSDPANSQKYISCLCPANTASLPQYARVGSQGVWVGEAQRVLGNKLNISVSDLSNQWGTFTPGTKAAVQEFQKSVRLPASGNLDRRTWKALQSAGC